MNNPTSKKSKTLYEHFPYPPRDPGHERTKLRETGLDNLERISHFCFNGQFDIKKSTRILVAGGGTGDSCIYLAEQLKASDAIVTYLDISSESMKIAKQRAAIRKLSNIEWIEGDILEVESLTSDRFDYISCTGVLHHLADPLTGLKRLKSVLKPNGVLGVMLYAKYGRQPVYIMQVLMKTLSHE